MHADTLWILYPMIIITAQRSYASAVLGVVILSVRLSHVCFMTNPKNLPAIFLYHILITANMQSEMGFPSSHQCIMYKVKDCRSGELFGKNMLILQHHFAMLVLETAD